MLSFDVGFLRCADIPNRVKKRLFIGINLILGRSDFLLRESRLRKITICTKERRISEILYALKVDSI
jgi:hypothetical protein